MLGRKILAFVWKDARLFAVDRQAVVMSFVVPVLIASILGWLDSSASSETTAKGFPLLVVDQDQSAISKAIVARLKTDGTVVPLPTQLEAAQKDVREGKVAAALVIPPSFGKQSSGAFLGGAKPALTFLLDPSKPMLTQVVRGVVIQQAASEIASRSFGAIAGDGSPPFEVREVKAAATQLKWAEAAHDYAGFAIQGLLFFAMEAAVSLARERRMGIWRRLAAAPVSPAVIVWSKALSSFLLAWAILLAVLAIGMGLFGIRILGSALGFAAITISTAAMAAGFGLAIATVGKTETQSRGISILLILVMLATGGAWFPMQRMPDWVQSMARWLPVRWAVEGLDAVTWRGLGLASSVQNAEVLTAFALVFLAIATWRFRLEAKRAV